MSPQMFIEFVKGLISEGASVILLVSAVDFVETFEKFEHPDVVAGANKHIY